MEMEQTFPTGNKDVDRMLLLRLNDRELLDTLSLATKNRLINKYLNDEEFWRIRFGQKYPNDFDTVQKMIQRSWKDFSLLLIKYLDLSKNDKDEALRLATKDDNRDFVEYFINQGAVFLRGLKGLIRYSKR